LALRWSGPPSYGRLRAFAEGVIGGLWRRVSDGRAIYLVIDGDIALTLGTILREELAVANDLLILDGIDLRDFDFVDLGRIRYPSNTVPVTIKSLVFAAGAYPAVAIA
jgi:ethanolamine utilization protein EutA